MPASHLQKWNAQLAYRSVVEATADKAGIDYLRHLVKNLAQSLNVQYAFVAEFAGAENRVRTLAYWSRDGWRANVEFPLITSTWMRAAASSPIGSLRRIPSCCTACR